MDGRSGTPSRPTSELVSVVLRDLDECGFGSVFLTPRSTGTGTVIDSTTVSFDTSC